MMISERIQNFIHQLDEGPLARFLKYVLLALAVASMMLLYDLRAYRNFSAPEAMDAAQVARNLATGQGFSTENIRPFSLYLIGRRHHLTAFDAANNAADLMRLNAPHPDLANAPLYPALLAGVMKITSPQVKVDLDKPFLSEGGNFRRYKPELAIAIGNQFLLFVVIALTYFIARKLFDNQAAWLAAILVFGSEILWRFSVSGLPTLLLMVFVLLLALCLLKIEELGRNELLNSRRIFPFAIGAGLIVGLGLLTRYAFGGLIVPTVFFLAIFGGTRRIGLAVSAGLAFLAVISPWILRNLAVSGTPFGTAGYALIENTDFFSGSQLMQSLNPNLDRNWVFPVAKKLALNTDGIFQDSLPRLGGSWMGILFFAGLLLALRNTAARRLRYFVLMSLAVLLIAQALGMTQLSEITPQINSENLLVLFLPLATIFGVAFFLTLLDQIQLPIIQLRWVAMAVLGVIIWLPLLLTLGSARTSPLVYPPYHPPEIQRISNWMQKNELMMSDIPWAVAWYGDRPCIGLTLNTKYDFSALNDFVKPVGGLYLTLNTIDPRLYSECMHGGSGSWGSFVYQAVAIGRIPAQFPLRYETTGLSSGLFFADKERWRTAP